MIWENWIELLRVKEMDLTSENQLLCAWKSMYLKGIVGLEWDLLHGMMSNYPQTASMRNLSMRNWKGKCYWIYFISKGYEICSGISTPCNPLVVAMKYYRGVFHWLLGLVVDAGLSVDFSHLECLTSSSVKLSIEIHHLFSQDMCLNFFQSLILLHINSFILPSPTQPVHSCVVTIVMNKSVIPVDSYLCLVAEAIAGTGRLWVTPLQIKWSTPQLRLISLLNSELDAQADAVKHWLIKE